MILNINDGYNDELKSKCPAINGYMIYVDKVSADALDYTFDARIEMERKGLSSSKIAEYTDIPIDEVDFSPSKTGTTVMSVLFDYCGLPFKRMRFRIICRYIIKILDDI